MLHPCKLWAAILLLGFLCAATANAQTSKYKGEPIVLKLKNGKTTHAGELVASDGIAFERYYKLFTVQFDKGKTYRIEQRDRGADPKFNPYLFLEDAAGVEIETDDDSAGDLNARIVFKAPKTGAYRLVATTIPKRQTGKFTLEIGAATEEQAKEADLKYRVAIFAELAPVQRGNLTRQLNQYFKSKGDSLAVADFYLASALGVEAEVEDVELARDFYKDAIKTFSAGVSKELVKPVRDLKSALKDLDRVGKEVNIVGTTLDGKAFELTKFKGKVVLVDFWGTWCGPCLAEMPNLTRAYQKYHGKGFEVVGVVSDQSDAIVSRFMESRKLPWACLNIADSRKMIDQHGITGYPSCLLVGADGRVVSLRARGPNLERLLERLLGESK